ncbi:MAG: hypothetical protein FJY56_18970 [Betaproteobacteria bacterium]|nr:hypothetical protein [Betaproteobacteria bacterium]
MNSLEKCLLTAVPVRAAFSIARHAVRFALGLIIGGVIALTISAAHGASITVDGNFADWGIQANGTVAGWTPNAGIRYTVEDQSNANGGFLSPGWGGQAYDAEALYITWGKKADNQTYLYLGMITGHNPALTT